MLLALDVCVRYLQKEDTLAFSVFVRLFFVLMIPIPKSFSSSCSVIFIRNSSLASSVCTERGGGGTNGHSFGDVVQQRVKH